MSRVEDLIDKLDRMREACQDAMSFVAEIDQASLGSDRMAQHALAMALQRIGEAARVIRLKHPEFVARHPEISWSELAGLRNLISHDYGAVNFERLWLGASERLAALADQIGSALNTLSGTEASSSSSGT